MFMMRLYTRALKQEAVLLADSETDPQRLA
jgi:hypothetical protein